MLNKQLPVKRAPANAATLAVHSIFPTIQGEGPFAGSPAIFVRLYGCNLQCPACDTEYTARKTAYTPTTLAKACNDIHPPLHPCVHSVCQELLVVITGGEPFRQNLLEYVRMLINYGYRVQIETNGTFAPGAALPSNWDCCTVVCSPKTGKINDELAFRADAFKYILQAGHVDPDDGLPTSTLGNVKQTSVARPPVGSAADIFVQPLDEQDETKNKANTAAALASCMKYGYRLCLQTHKMLDLP